MSRRRVALAASLSAVFGSLCVLAQTAPAQAAPAQTVQAPWRAGAFEAASSSLAAAGRAAAGRDEAEPGLPAVVLFDETTVRFAHDGRAVVRRHRVYRVLEPSDEWSTLEARWSPWTQERPALRARVVGPDGGERWLDPSSIVESTSTSPAAAAHAAASPAAAPAPTADASSASAASAVEVGTRRVLRARLPRPVAGSVVEEEIVVRDHTSPWPVGTFGRHYLVSIVPVRHARLVLDAPRRLPLRYGVRRAPGVEAETTRVDGPDGERVRVAFEARNLEAATVAEVGAPSHRPLYPHVAFSTGWSWSRIATWLEERTVRSIAGARLDGLPTRAELAGHDPEAAARRVVAAIRSRVRDDGLEISATPSEPLAPDALLARGRGDSLDLAVLTVAALRRVGLEAHVALIQAGAGRDVEPQMPGLGAFEHALVRVADDLWIDPAHPFAAVGSLPLQAQGRLALVARSSDPSRAASGSRADKAVELVRTPVSRPSDNLALEQRLVEMADFGPGRIVETSHYQGSAARVQRSVTAALDAEARRRGYGAFAREFHRATAVGRLEESSPHDLDAPFTLRLEILESERVRTGVERAVVEVPVVELGGRLPPLFFEQLPGPRREEYVFFEPFVTRWVYRIEPPAGFRAVLPPEPVETMPLGPGAYRQELSIDGTGALLAELELDVGQRLLSAAQLEAMHADVQRFLERPPLEIEMVVEALETEDGGRVDEAIRALLESVRRAPDRAVRRVRLARALMRLGLVEEARRQAELAVELAPTWAPAHATLGRAAFLGFGGVPAGPEADLETAREGLREAQRLDPNDEAVRLDLAAALLAAAGPLEPSAPDGLAIQALDVLRSTRRSLGSERAAIEETRLLLRLERDEEAADIAEVASRPALVVATRALLGRAPSSVALGEAVDHPDTLREAAFELVRARRYRAAATVLRAVGTQEATDRAAELVAVARHETLEGLSDDPSTPVRGLVVDVARRRAQSTELTRWLHPRALAGLDDGTLAPLRSAIDEIVDRAVAPWERLGEGPREGERLREAARRGVTLPPAVRADLALARYEDSLAGAPHLGYRITVGGPGSATRLYSTLLGGGPKIVAAGSMPALLGVEALDRLRQGDLPGARRWLDWAADETAADEAFRAVWTPTDPDEPVSVDALSLAAAVLAASWDRSGEAAAMIQSELARDALDPARRRALERAAADAQRTLDVGVPPSIGDPIGRELRSLLAASVDERTLDESSLDDTASRARAILDRAPRRTPERLRAAAAVLAAARQPFAARGLLEEAIRRAGPWAPTEGDHLVLAHIAEAAGLRLLARAAAARIEAPAAGEDPVSWRSLAAARDR